MENELYKKYGITPLERHSAVGKGFSESHLLTYAANLEYKESHMKCHEICKFCNNLEHVLKHIVDAWNAGWFEKLDEDKKEIVKNRIKWTFTTFRFFVQKRNEISDLNNSKYNVIFEKYLNFVQENNILKGTE